MSQSPGPSSAPLEHRRASVRCTAWFWRMSVWAARIFLILCILLAVCLLGVRYLLAPVAGNYTPQIERALSQQLNQPVTIGQFAVDWAGYHPVLKIRKLSIAGTALEVDSIDAVLAWRSVMTPTRPVFMQLTVQHPDILIERHADQRISVAGVMLPQDTSQTSDDSTLRWWLAQSSVVVRDAVVRWRDALSHAALNTDGGSAKVSAPTDDVVFRGLTFRQSTGWHRVQLSTRYQPTSGSGDAATGAMSLAMVPLDVRADLHYGMTSPLHALHSWSGKLYASSGDMSAKQWDVLLNLLPHDAASGKPGLDGQVTAWADLKNGKLRQIDAHLKLRAASWQPDAGSTPVVMSNLVARLLFKTASGVVSSSNAGQPASVLDLSAMARQKMTLVWKDLSFSTPAGTKIPPFSGELDVSPAKVKSMPVAASGAIPVQISGQLSRLDIGPLASWLQTLPPTVMPSDIAAYLLQSELRGMLQQAHFEFRLHPVNDGNGVMSWTSANHYSLQAGVQGLAFRAMPASGEAAGTAGGWPGASGINVAVDLNEKGGKLNVDSHDLVLTAPGVAKRDDWPFRLADIALNWQHNDQGVLVDVAHATLKNDHQTLTFNGTQQIPLRQSAPAGIKTHPSPLTADWRLTLDAVSLPQLDQFLPLAMDEHTRHWLVQGLPVGNASNLSVKAKGDLHRLAGDKSQHWNGEGQAPANPVLQASVKLHGVTVNIAPDEFAPLPGKNQDAGPKQTTAPAWPLFEQVDGTLTVTDAALAIQVDKAKVNGMPLSQTTIRIQDLYSHNARLFANGVVNADAQGMVDYVRNSPVDHMLGGLLTRARLSGNAQLNLGLVVPLDDTEHTLVDSSLNFNGVNGRIDPAYPETTNLRGKLAFRHDGFAILNGGLTGQLLGFPMRVTGQQEPGKSGQVVIDGRASVAAVKKEYGDAEWSSALQYLSGDTDLKLDVGWHDHHTSVAFDSTLSGLASTLPAPFAKSAAVALPVSLGLHDAEPADVVHGTLHRKLDLSLGDVMTGHYDLIRPNDQTDSSWSLATASVGIGQPPPPLSAQSHGIAVGVTADKINLDDWLEIISAVRESQPAGAGQSGSAASRDVAVALPHPEKIEAHISHLIAAGTDWRDMTFTALARGDDWHAVIDAPDLAGQVDWIRRNGVNSGPSQPDLLRTRLDRLVIHADKADAHTGTVNPDTPAGPVKPVAHAAKADAKVTQLPEIDLRAEQFVLHDHDLGVLTLQAQHRIEPARSVWTISQLGIENSDAHFEANGDWITPNNSAGATGHTQLHYTMKMEDSGKLLGRFDLKNVLAAAKGTLSGDIAWQGAPYSIDLPSLSGSLQFETGKGQFLQIDPGAGRLLSVLNLQSLSRRAQMDFRDIFSRGLVFDSTQGALTIHQGIASSRNLRIAGPSGIVLLDGQVDLAAETQNMHVIVLPDVNLGAASLGLVVVNPVIGIGSALAQYLLKDKLASALRFEYDISGSWSEPNVVRVERRSTAGEVSERRNDAFDDTLASSAPLN